MRGSIPCFTLGLLASAFMGAATSLAATASSEISVTDCNAARRAQEKVEVGSTGTVVVRLIASDNKAGSFTLVNRESGDSLVAELTKDGAFTFNGVSAGTWAFCPTAELASVDIITAAPSGSGSAITLGAIGGGIASAVALVAGSGGGSSSSGSTGGSVLSGPAKPLAQIAGTVTPQTQAVSSDEPVDCFTDQPEPPPISPLS